MELRNVATLTGTETEAAMILAVAADPTDDTRKLALADFYQENGHPYRAEYIKLSLQHKKPPSLWAIRKATRHMAKLVSSCKPGEDVREWTAGLNTKLHRLCLVRMLSIRDDIRWHSRPCGLCKGVGWTLLGFCEWCKGDADTGGILQPDKFQTKPELSNPTLHSRAVVYHKGFPNKTYISAEDVVDGFDSTGGGRYPNPTLIRIVTRFPTIEEIVFPIAPLSRITRTDPPPGRGFRIDHNFIGRNSTYSPLRGLMPGWFFDDDGDPPTFPNQLATNEWAHHQIVKAARRWVAAHGFPEDPSNDPD